MFVAYPGQNIGKHYRKKIKEKKKYAPGETALCRKIVFNRYTENIEHIHIHKKMRGIGMQEASCERSPVFIVMLLAIWIMNTFLIIFWFLPSYVRDDRSYNDKSGSDQYI